MTLLRRLFGGGSQRQRAQTDAPPPLPAPENETVVIGDIHGRADLLSRLLDMLDPGTQIVTVGDYIDRGEESAEVLDILRRRQQAAPETFACLMGNHEKMMLDFLDRPEERGRRWLRNGGLQTLASFGVGQVNESSSPREMVRAGERLRTAMPEGMESWLRELPKTWNSGTLWVVHGAADPNVPMTRQDERVLLWGHQAFLRDARPDGLWVAHGHTVFDLPHMKRSRIAVDTGAYHTGRLTAARVLPAGEVEFIQAST
jgi:serine/threonine protein phosphatase 1